MASTSTKTAATEKDNGRDEQVLVHPFHNDGVLHYADRLVVLTRIKSDGEPVVKGATEPGSCRVQLLTKRFSRTLPPVPLILAHCNSQLVLSARIKHWPVSVSSDGLEIGIWLDDYSGSQNYHRKFFLKFFNDIAANAFFCIYTGIVEEEHGLVIAPAPAAPPSYHQLQEQSAAAQQQRLVHRKHHHNKIKQGKTSKKRKALSLEFLSDLDEGSEASEDEAEGEQDTEEEVTDYAGNHSNDFLNAEIDDNYAFSQDVYAENCVVVLPFSRKRLKTRT